MLTLECRGEGLRAAVRRRFRQPEQSQRREFRIFVIAEDAGDQVPDGFGLLGIFKMRRKPALGGGWFVNARASIGKIEGASGGSTKLNDRVSGFFQERIVMDRLGEPLRGGEQHDVIIRAVVPVAWALGIHAVRGVKCGAFFDEPESLPEEWLGKSLVVSGDGSRRQSDAGAADLRPIVAGLGPPAIPHTPSGHTVLHARRDRCLNCP